MSNLQIREILAYGEDALTLWAVTTRLSEILQQLDDASDPAHCQVLYRPSFGRSGGADSSQFGEFDFILLAEHCLYLGESKWYLSSELTHDGQLLLRPEQLVRHRMLRFYVECWAFGSYSSWHEFEQTAPSALPARDLAKRIAPCGSLLATNLQTVLGVIREHYGNSPPTITDVLLYFHRGLGVGKHPQSAGAGFEFVTINYDDATCGNLLRFVLT